MTRLQLGRRRSVANIRREAGTCAPEDLFEALLAHFPEPGARDGCARFRLDAEPAPPRANSATARERGRCVCACGGGGGGGTSAARFSVPSGAAPCPRSSRHTFALQEQGGRPSARRGKAFQTEVHFEREGRAAGHLAGAQAGGVGQTEGQEEGGVRKAGALHPHGPRPRAARPPLVSPLSKRCVGLPFRSGIFRGRSLRNSKIQAFCPG